MVHSVDLTFDDELDAAVRARWRALSDLGLPSLSTHQGASNRPHITLLAGETLELHGRPVFEPFTVRLGAPLTFPRRSGAVLALGVVPTLDLLALHRRVAAVVEGGFDHTRPGAWTPHVTLSRRIVAEQTGAALEALASLGPLPDGEVLGLRFWNGDTRTVMELVGP
ncbi:hypothetical protein ASF83_09185 [Plantibacter sp. Leaf171]|uniref:2'-5' RNA ligase family protein n=1 Tax=unclassified Plantibacter TaxID=2624265 RepID=UPI0006F8A743|nr:MULTISPECIES: 2'-5' RNA ligase family protein [unclassified Plantibacter]KQM16055.1 hypothetical protein ASE44_09200 [Plantibacter sp. Leaf1]KQR59195.1 hypothetical protein ASF83_09185 [Plantibacter sp. Leaf171]